MRRRNVDGEGEGVSAGMDGGAAGTASDPPVGSAESTDDSSLHDDLSSDEMIEGSAGDDSDGEDESAGREQSGGGDSKGKKKRKLRRKKRAIESYSRTFAEEEDSDDTVLLIAGALGFLLFLVLGMFGQVLSMDVDQSHIMATGLVSLVLLALTVTFCSGKSKPGEEDKLSALVVFVGMGCLGLMIGGMLSTTILFAVQGHNSVLDRNLYRAGLLDRAHR